MSRSKKYSINIRDVIHGIIMAFGAAFLDAIIMLMTTEKTIDLPLIKEASIIGVIACLTYVFKKFFQNSDSKFSPEPKKTLL